MAAILAFGADFVGVVVVTTGGSTSIYSVEVEEHRGSGLPQVAADDVVYETLPGSKKWVDTLESGRALALVEGRPVALLVTSAGVLSANECSECGGSGVLFCTNCGSKLEYAGQEDSGELFEDDSPEFGEADGVYGEDVEPDFLAEVAKYAFGDRAGKGGV